MSPAASIVSLPAPLGTADASTCAKFTSLEQVRSEPVSAWTHPKGGRRTDYEFKFRVTGTYCARMLRFTQQLHIQF